MDIQFTQAAWEDYLYWQKQDRKKLERIHLLLKAIQREPFSGEGKPEPLKFDLKGFWSRRIDHEHRLVYRVQEGRMIVIACRYHY